MTKEELVQRVIDKPIIQRLKRPEKLGGLGYRIDDIKKSLTKVVHSVVSALSYDYEWDFALKTTTTTSVASQSGYTLTGVNNDASQIFNIRYGDDAVLLIRKTQVAMDHILSGGTVGAVKYWVPNGRDIDGAANVEIVGTPGASGETIKYRYWRNDVKIDDFPVLCDGVLEAGLTMKMVESYRRIYKAELRDAIAAYTRSGGEVDVARQDTSIIANNRRMSAKHGWGG